MPNRRARRSPKPRIALFDDPGSDRERSCTSKDAYASPEHARAVALMNGMAERLTAYECRHCGAWHLTRRR